MVCFPNGRFHVTHIVDLFFSRLDYSISVKVVPYYYHSQLIPCCAAKMISLLSTEGGARATRMWGDRKINRRMKIFFFHFLSPIFLSSVFLRPGFNQWVAGEDSLGV